VTALARQWRNTERNSANQREMVAAIMQQLASHTHVIKGPCRLLSLFFLCGFSPRFGVKAECQSHLVGVGKNTITCHQGNSKKIFEPEVMGTWKLFLRISVHSFNVAILKALDAAAEMGFWFPHSQWIIYTANRWISTSAGVSWSSANMTAARTNWKALNYSEKFV